MKRSSIMMRKLIALFYKNYLAGALSVIFLLACGHIGLAQQPKPVESACRLIDKNSWSLYMTYERLANDKAERKVMSQQKVWLRLHNNTDCTILVSTDHIVETKLPDGQITTDLQEGDTINIGFKVQDAKRTKPPQPAYNWGDVTYLSRLMPGRSVVFGVPLFYFKKRFDIAVPFKYEWEGGASPGTGRIIHLVYFYSEDLPELR